MKSFVVFSILDQCFGIDIESVKRILPSQPLTKMPDEDEHIEGMFQYQDEVLKVVSFRHLIGLKSYSAQLRTLFPELKDQHKEWLDALTHSVDEGVPFSKTTDPHACQLGKWIDSFHPDNVEVLEIMKDLSFHHQRLHHSAIDVLALGETCVEEAHVWIEKNVQEIYEHTMSYLSKIEDKSEEVAVDLQRCLILKGKDNVPFGINIDAVEDIVHIEEDALHKASTLQTMGSFMNVDSILDYEGKLVTIVKDIRVEKTA
ncbi:MAG: hypothetical protein COA44_10060 [Arcobacter sp.]|nr:MAG: hypothetical protein COA44_10060 [Arcobacter sp.]